MIEIEYTAQQAAAVASLRSAGFKVARRTFPGEDGAPSVHFAKSIDGVDADFSLNLLTFGVLRWGSCDRWSTVGELLDTSSATIPDPTPVPATTACGAPEQQAGIPTTWRVIGFQNFRPSDAVAGLPAKWFAELDDGSRWLLDPRGTLTCFSDRPLSAWHAESRVVGSVLEAWLVHAETKQRRAAAGSAPVARREPLQAVAAARSGKPSPERPFAGSVPQQRKQLALF